MLLEQEASQKEGCTEMISGLPETMRTNSLILNFELLLLLSPPPPVSSLLILLLIPPPPKQHLKGVAQDVGCGCEGTGFAKGI